MLGMQSMSTLQTHINDSFYLKEKILNFVGTKDIYILASSINLQDVDIKAPLLVRLNSSRRWGNCDIWFNNQSQDPKFQLDSAGNYRDKYIIRGNGDREGANMVRNYPEEFMSRTFFWDPAEWKTMTERTGIERPLTGTIAAYWFHVHTGNKITLLNYDFYKTVRRHTVRNIPQPAPVHKPELDERYLRSINSIHWENIVL